MARALVTFCVCSIFAWSVSASYSRESKVKGDTGRFEKWFVREWNAFAAYHPQATEKYTFVNRLNDLCEIKVNRSGCWETRGKFQHSVVLDTGNIYGKQLFLDCMPQSCEADEFIYHEAITHPVLVAHPNPRTVLIAGGGEGGTAREILRHQTVEKVVMVDLDPDLVKVSEEHLPYWGGVRADPRFTLIEGDAVAYMNHTDKDLVFDVVIFDLPDAVKDTAFLYSSEVLKLAKSRMAPNGVFGTHSGGNVCIPEEEELYGYPGEPCRFMPRLFNTLKDIWEHATVAASPMALWQEFHGFMYASDGRVPHKISAIETDKIMRGRLIAPGSESHPNLKGELRYYGGMTHAHMHKLPKFYLDYFQTVTEILTPEMIKESFSDSETNHEGLSEMKICACDPKECLFHNGVRGPLKRESDVYETDDDETILSRVSARKKAESDDEDDKDDKDDKDKKDEQDEMNEKKEKDEV